MASKVGIACVNTLEAARLYRFKKFSSKISKFREL
ncbi:hypothetical protein T11_5904 [Trichinella zimbabwensis]|uniref:Uncharacterized protein n=1 Tax=Trichinella zimbabwensis TaxID=268475 RepID=A0A0V1F2R6_9BILA|nr:hypothetical protein T11_5904 [Trichinella zimbabwensis]